MKMKKIILTFLCLVIFLTPIYAGNTASIVISYRINPICVLSVTDGGVDYGNSSYVTVDGDVISSVLGRQLVWTSNIQAKIVVSCNDPTGILSVRATNLKGNGISTGVVVLNDINQLFITDIFGEIGGCDLDYKLNRSLDHNQVITVYYTIISK